MALCVSVILSPLSIYIVYLTDNFLVDYQPTLKREEISYYNADVTWGCYDSDAADDEIMRQHSQPL